MNLNYLINFCKLFQIKRIVQKHALTNTNKALSLRKPRGVGNFITSHYNDTPRMKVVYSVPRDRWTKIPLEN